MTKRDLFHAQETVQASPEGGRLETRFLSGRHPVWRPVPGSAGRRICRKTKLFCKIFNKSALRLTGVLES
jgi:hypothetical protein